MEYKKRGALTPLKSIAENMGKSDVEILTSYVAKIRKIYKRQMKTTGMYAGKPIQGFVRFQMLQEVANCGNRAREIVSNFIDKTSLSSNMKSPRNLLLKSLVEIDTDDKYNRIAAKELMEVDFLDRKICKNVYQINHVSFPIFSNRERELFLSVHAEIEGMFMEKKRDKTIIEWLESKEAQESFGNM